MGTTELSAATRQQLTAFFGARANYVTLKDETKEPTGIYRLGSKRKTTSRFLEAPEKNNYGVIPVCDFFVLDVDIHKVELEASIDFFEKLFGVKLANTFSVKTPSGGVHYYLRLPIKNAIFNGSLRGYSKALSELLGYAVPALDADIRSSEATGYVVGPGSFVAKMRNGQEYPTPGSYYLLEASRAMLETGDFNQLEEISEESAQALAQLRVLQNKRKEAGRAKKQVEPAPEEAPIPLATTRVEVTSFMKVQAGLASRVKKNPKLEFHKRRAFVSAALRCCYSDYSIALACRDLDINRDSYTDGTLVLSLVIADLNRLRLKSELNHTYYCKVGVAKSRSRTVKTLDELNAETKHKIETRTLGRGKRIRKPRVISIPRVIARLEAEKKKKLPQVTKDALLLIDVLFQPLLNVGASKVVVAQASVASTLGISASRLSAALRLLRRKRIIQIADRQKTGLAATYTIMEPYIHKALTSALKYQWVRSKAEAQVNSILLYDRFEHQLTDLVTGELHKLDFTVIRPVRIELTTPPDAPLDLFAKQYMRHELPKN